MFFEVIMNTSWRLGWASFLAGVGACITMRFISPMFWYLGLFAGFGVGYMSYEFRSLLKGIPVAARASLNATNEKSLEFLDWLEVPHPFVVVAIISLPIFWIVFHPLCVFLNKFSGHRDQGGDIFLTLVFGTAACMILVLLNSLVSNTSAVKREMIFWRDPIDKDEVQERKYWNKGAVLVEVTYGKVFKHLFLGWADVFGTAIDLTAWFVFFGLWKFAGLFVWYLFKKIHSDKRVLCGTSGALGASISHLIFHRSAALTSSEEILFVICGGIFGAMIGMASWEIISKRILHVQEAKV